MAQTPQIETSIIRILKARFSAARQERDSLALRLEAKTEELTQLRELLIVARKMNSDKLQAESEKY